MSIKINKNNLVYTLTNTDSDKTPYKIKKKKKVTQVSEAYHSPPIIHLFLYHKEIKPE